MNQLEVTKPQPESRVKKTLLNARVNLLFYFLTLCLSFFSRKIFLDCLGANFVGLTGTVQNLLGFLNLAELGIGSAIGYVLYKPLFDRDHAKINEIISVMGYLYRWIGIIILIAGLLLSISLPLIFPTSDTGFDIKLIYLTYFAFLGSSLIGYFINYRQNLLGADQKNYVVTGFYQSINIIKTIIQMMFTYYLGNLYVWIMVEFTFGIFYSIILNWKINQTYPWLKAELKLGKKVLKKYPQVMEKTKQLFIHKLAGFVQLQTTPFLIYAFVNLNVVALYGNYTLITDKMASLFTSALSSTEAGVGNLIAEGNKNKILNVFWELFSIQLFIASFCVFELFILINPFIELWLGEKYILPQVVLYMLLLRYFISQSRSTITQFIFGFGLFSDTWAPIAESIIFLLVAIVAGYFWGLPGVLFGGIVSLCIIVWGWKPTFLFIKGFQISALVYWINLLKNYTVSICSMIIVIHIYKDFIHINPSSSISNWLLVASITSLLFFITYGISQYCTNSAARRLVNRAISR